MYACFEHDDIWMALKSSEKRDRTLSLVKLLLLWVIPIGTLIATIASARESIETDKKMDRLDPMNQPVSEIVGNATVEVMGPWGGFPMPIIGVDLQSYVILEESNAPPNTLMFGGQNVLYAIDTTGHYTTSTGPTTHTYVMNIKRHPDFAHGPVQVIADFSQATTKMVMERINWTELHLALVPPQSEILGGSVEIVVNATVRKTFSVPHQVCLSNGTFYATNIIAKP
jgi:hypothetical protein